MLSCSTLSAKLPEQIFGKSKSGEMSLTKLAKIRGKMKELGVNLFVVLSCDAHSSEYVSKADG